MLIELALKSYLNILIDNYIYDVCLYDIQETRARLICTNMIHMMKILYMNSS
jgi:hypothetical protein